jgi:hypothetical protein
MTIAFLKQYRQCVVSSTTAPLYVLRAAISGRKAWWTQ